MMKCDKIFNSEKIKGFEGFQLASGYISSTSVLFEKENIYVKIEAKGLVEFFDSEDRLIKSVSLPAQTGGREVYDEAECAVDGSSIIIKFPIVEWVDNYPHCDGEQDRWDKRIIAYHTLSFDVFTEETQIR